MTNHPDSPSTEAPPVLDPAALARLRELDPTGRSGIHLKVMRTYEQSIVRLMAQFEVARAAGDLAGLRHVSHTLRSSSASVGALVFSARCTAVETLVRDGATQLDAELDAMKIESARVLAAVRAMLAEQGPAA